MVSNLFSDSPAVGDWLNIRPQAIRDHDNDDITTFLRGKMKEVHDSVKEYDNNAYYLPDRLIDVGISGLRLVERNNIRANSGERQQYCTLSYCWGPPEDAQTQTKATSTNIQQCLESLDYETLSPVLQDAVKVTRSLSVPYLWVDSLCILQDDISDWQRQCGQMDEIYGNACATLIAASSRTCKEGFLNPKQNGLRFPYQSRSHPEITGSFMMYFTHAFSEVESCLVSSLIPDLHNDLMCSQWARRGWTFQEEAMAGVRIVFGHYGVYFGRGSRYVSIDNIIPAGLTEGKRVTSLQSKDELHRAWEQVMSRYTAFTSSSFTVQTDLLPALSGLARLFGDRLQEKYLAGHWVSRLHLTLLWMHDSERALPSLDVIINRHIREPYLIPTWSCLTRGKLWFDLPNVTCPRRSEITVVDGHVSLASDNPYGAINDACLTIEGFVLDLASLCWVESPDCLVGSEALCSYPQVRFAKDDYKPHILPEEVKFTLFDSYHEHGKSGDSYDYGIESYGYGLNLDFQVDLGNVSLLRKFRAPFDQLISRVTLLLVTSGQNAVDKLGGYGLVLVALEGASERSFLRAGTFGPRGLVQESRDSLPCLKRLMKRETVKLF